MIKPRHKKTFHPVPSTQSPAIVAVRPFFSCFLSYIYNHVIDMMLQLTHFRLLVSNFKECFLFYRDVLGFAIDWGDENSWYAELHTGDNIKLALFRKELMAEAVPSAYQPSAIECHNKVALIFAVDNVDEFYEYLKENNAIIVTQPQDRPAWGLRTAHFRDPDGNLIEIFSNLGS